MHTQNLPATPAFPGRTRRFFRHASVLLASLGLLATARAQTLAEPFNGSAVNTSTWAQGGTSGSSPIVTVGSGKLTINVNRLTGVRTTLLSHAVGFNPFAQPLLVNLQGISLDGVGTGSSSTALYAVVGRLSSDTGGAATSAKAAGYAVGGGGYGGALGIQLLHYAGTIPWRLQVQDSTSGAVAATNFYLSTAPTAIAWTIDGAAASPSYRITLTGAIFTSTPAGTYLTDSGATAVGPITKLTLAGLTTGGNIVSRLAIGAGNNNTVASAAVASFDAVNVALAPPRPEPEPWLLGVNLSSACFGTNIPGVYNTDYTYPTGADLDYFKARGMELIRLPFLWERMQRTLYGALDTAELARMDAFLDAAEQRGMKVIPDVHNYARYRIAGVSHIIGTAQVPRAAFKDFWQRLALHLKDRQCIWAYGLMNEPNNLGAHTWKTTAQEGVNGIRLSDTRHAILVPGNEYSNANGWVGYSGDLIDLVDPSDNLVFEAHQYLDADHSGTGDANYDAEGVTPTTGVTRLNNFINWCRYHNVRGFLGEFGVPDNDPRWSVALANMVAHMKANNLPGTYWAAGPMWDGYRQRCNIRDNHDEAPQMNAMVPHADGPGTGFWPAFTWYKDAVTPGENGSYSYNYKSSTATLAANFADTAAKHSGVTGISFAYTIPSGGYAGAGMHINGGVNLTANTASSHVLSFYAKSGTAGSVRVFLVTTAGLNSAKIDTATVTTLNSTWKLVRIPLASFFNANFNGSQRVQRVAFEGLPANGTAHVVHLDTFVVERPDAQVPAVTAAVSGSTTVAAGATINASATASDTGGAIDYVEFFIGHQRVGIDYSSPYAAALTAPTVTGAHQLAAVAVDLHGNTKRSNSITLTVTP